MSRRESPSSERFPAWIGLIAAAALLATRATHLIGPLDDPHSWRQCDAAFYSLDLFRRGLDVLHPRVCWLGPHGTLILDFPLTETLAALLYRAFGVHLYLDRLVTLGFFLIASFYLYRIVARLSTGRAAWLATLAYLAFPLGQYYSRAVQPDFAAAAFAHGFLFHALAAIERRSTGHTLLAAVAGSLAALIKAPVLLAPLPALALAALVAGDGGVVILLVLALGLPAGALALWRGHVEAVNGAAPDWSFLPGWYREVNPAWWYFGTAEQRMDPEPWVRIGRRILRAGLTPVGAALGVVGLLLGRARAQARADARAFALAWGIGVAAYVLVFFNLNAVHDYYQIPALAPCAMLVGLGADALWARLPRWLPLGPAMFVAFVALALAAPGRLDYYRVDWLRVEAGREIAARVPADDLVVASDHGSGYSDPRLLQRAGRVGWALAIRDLEPGRLATLAGLRARWVAVVTDSGHPGHTPPAFLSKWQAARVPVEHAGRVLGRLDLYRLPAARR